jgi:hypothetical protein
VDAEDYAMSMGLADLLDKQIAKQERHNELIQLAVRNKEPVCIGVWGPTGQRIFVYAESREGSGE